MIRLRDVGTLWVPKGQAADYVFYGDENDRFAPLLRADHHCPVNSVTILRVCNANPFRAVKQQVGAMSSGIDPLL